MGDAGQVGLYAVARGRLPRPWRSPLALARQPARRPPACCPDALRSGFLGPHTQVASREHGSCTPRHSPTEAIPTSPQGRSLTEQGVGGKEGSARGMGGGLEGNTDRGRCNVGWRHMQ